MSTQVGCNDCRELRNLWYSTLSKFSESVTNMIDARKNAAGYEQAHCATALAQVAVDNARMMLDLHRFQHAGPESPGSSRPHTPLAA